MMKTRKILLLTLIVILAAFLRLWQLGNVPPSPDWDEAALAYDAHSLYETGRDEFGIFMPPVLRSFDDYKPAVYAYLAIPTVELFGMNTFAVRLPSAVFGILAVIALYLLVKELLRIREKKPVFSVNYYEAIALLSAFLIAISPWHIQFSRTAFESNVGLTVNLFAALFFLKGLQKPWFLFLSAFLAAINLSVYQSERVFTPIIMIALIIIYRKEVFRLRRKYLIGAVLIGVVTLLPLLAFFVTDSKALVRVKSTSILSNQTEILGVTTERVKDDKDRDNFLGQVFDNRRVVYAKTIAGSYLAHFDPNWLFLTGDSSRHHAPRMGLLYLLMLPFLLTGIYHLLFGKFEKTTKYLIFSWLLLAPIPASVTYETPHAVRTLNMLPMLLILTAIGFVVSYHFINSFKRWFIPGAKYIIYTLILLAATGSFIYFLNQYFVQQNYFYAADWQYGYSQAVSEVQYIKADYKKIIVSDKRPMDKSYIFFLFYLNYPPQEYQKASAGSTKINEHHFDKYEFREFNWVKEKNNAGVLFVGSLNDFPPNIQAKKIIYYPNKERAILLVDPKDNL